MGVSNKTKIIGILFILLLLLIGIGIFLYLKFKNKDNSKPKPSFECPDDIKNRLSTKHGYKRVLTLKDNGHKDGWDFEHLTFDGKIHTMGLEYGPKNTKAVEFGIHSKQSSRFSSWTDYEIGFFDKNKILIEEDGIINAKISGEYREVFVCFQIITKDDESVLVPMAYAKINKNKIKL